ncbi:MAG: Uma2 family endonuclease [Chloroflexaceae bacterium]|nr:Uma2 family endonuclease [Chloroflexaceae bacterium]
MSNSLPMLQPVHQLNGPAAGNWFAHYTDIPDDGQRYEVVRGVSRIPTPDTTHKVTITLFCTYFMQQVQFVGLGHMFKISCDVELTAHDIVQPDITVVLNQHLAIITHKRIVGVPDLLVEILSPGTATHDRRKKYATYARVGVPEYWIADPVNKTIEIFTHDTASSSYRSLGVFTGETPVPSLVLPTLNVPVIHFLRPHERSTRCQTYCLNQPQSASPPYNQPRISAAPHPASGPMPIMPPSPMMDSAMK